MSFDILLYPLTWPSRSTFVQVRTYTIPLALPRLLLSLSSNLAPLFRPTLALTLGRVAGGYLASGGAWSLLTAMVRFSFSLLPGHHLAPKPSPPLTILFPLNHSPRMYFRHPSLINSFGHLVFLRAIPLFFRLFAKTRTLCSTTISLSPVFSSFSSLDHTPILSF